eukprot:gene40386-49944_t
MYINGTLSGNSSGTSTTLFSTAGGYLGKSFNAGDAILNGSINEFRVWSTTLSASQVLLNYIHGPDECFNCPSVEPTPTFRPSVPEVLLTTPVSVYLPRRIGNETVFKVVLPFLFNNQVDDPGRGAYDLVVNVSSRGTNYFLASIVSGVSFVLYGGLSVENVYLAELDVTRGFVLSGWEEEECSGLSVSSAGDVNKDGHVDLLIGSLRTNFLFSGMVYIVLGTGQNQRSNVDLSTLVTTAGGYVVNGP